jgi:hypothetical protein
VTKAQGKRRKAVQLRSWINPARSLGLVKKESEWPEPPFLSIPSPKLVGGDFSALQLPPGIEPAMIQDLVKRTRFRPFASTHFAYSKERPAANETCSHQPP